MTFSKTNQSQELLNLESNNWKLIGSLAWWSQTKILDKLKSWLFVAQEGGSDGHES